MPKQQPLSFPNLTPPNCNGVIDANGNIQHDEYTACPYHDTILAPTLASYMPPNHQAEKLRAATPDKAMVLLNEAARYIELQAAEIDRLRKMEADELYVIWWTLRRALYGMESQRPDNTADIIAGMPQEWSVIQEVVTRLDAMPFSLDRYQLCCSDTANYAEAGTGTQTAITYTVLGLTGEAGEVSDKWKKVLRGDHGEDGLTPEVRMKIREELGDVLWYVARCAKELGFNLSDVAQGNLDKLTDRKARGVIKGSGDAR